MKVRMMLKPKCIGEHRQARGMTNLGWLLPCCYADGRSVQRDFSDLLKDHLKLETVEKIEDIENSDEWNNFFHMLENNPEKAPYPCHYYCGVNPGFKAKDVYK